MRIISVAFNTSDLRRAETFYGELLGLPVHREDDGLLVRIGSSALVLHEGPTGPGRQHLAWTIPRRQLASAKLWLSSRVTLLRNAEGQDEFDMPATWNARSLYFADPDGNILELIVRRDIPDDRDHPFTAADIQNISEAGVPVADVATTADGIRAAFGIPAYGSGSASFQPLGTVHGMLILVAPGRSWFPTGEPSGTSRLEVAIEADRDGRFSPAPGIVLTSRRGTTL
ncbi:VOC family protein [Arthrobacter sp. Y-9]|uniref:VOC family protein n=1 Tax=Arthrobacter sp. Y-9 TaxID=3039385 RepID=UPI00241CAEA1|nr:VOC family protein [Arthrobacter sp. Y-9]WFR84628.1 hypothetical protein P9849_03005 [Arthrobacter sp. Y-9]